MQALLPAPATGCFENRSLRFRFHANKAEKYTSIIVMDMTGKLSNTNQ